MNATIMAYVFLFAASVALGATFSSDGRNATGMGITAAGCAIASALIVCWGIS